MSFNIYEPWRDAEAHAARLEAEYKKYGTGNCESCGKTVWHDEHFCAECMGIAIDDVRYFTDWLAEKNGWPREIALETAYKDLSRGKRPGIVWLYDSASDIVAEEIADGK